MAEPKIVKDIHIKQWNGDENYWSTQKPLMEGEIGVINKTNTKNAIKIVVGNGTSTTSELLTEGNVFYAGIGAGYILPTASNTLLGGVKISDTYFYTDGEVLKLKVLKSIWDDNPDSPDEFNKANKSDNDAFISSPATDWKLRGDFYAETLYADEARIKNVIYEQETNVDYYGKYIDVHKEDSHIRDFTIQLNPAHFKHWTNPVRPDDQRWYYEYTLDVKGQLWLAEQTIHWYHKNYSDMVVYSESTINTGDQPVVEDEFLNKYSPKEGYLWRIVTIPTKEAPIYDIEEISITCYDGLGRVGVTPVDWDVQSSKLNSHNWYENTVSLLVSEKYGSMMYINEIDYIPKLKIDINIPETLLEEDKVYSVTTTDGNFDFSYTENNLKIYVPYTISGETTNDIITLYDNTTTINILEDTERSGMRIYNYYAGDKTIPSANRKIAELSVDNQGILAYASDNSDLTNFRDVLTVNRYLDNIDGFVWLNSTPARPVSLTYYNKIPSDKIDLASLPKLNMFLNQNNIGTYDPSNAAEQNVTINTCTSVVANGTEHKVDIYGKITLADSTWTNELNNLLSTAVQKITFDDVDYQGPTITLKSKIQKITLDDSEVEADENGNVDLKSKIQSITYDGVKHEESDIVIYATRLNSLETVKGSGADAHKYNTINITEDPATRTYWISHYDTNTINEPVGTDTNIIGESGSKTSFNLMSSLSYDHYGHAEQYSSYTLDFSALVSRIQQLETKVAELEEQLKAS